PVLELEVCGGTRPARVEPVEGQRRPFACSLTLTSNGTVVQVDPIAIVVVPFTTGALPNRAEHLLILPPDAPYREHLTARGRAYKNTVWAIAGGILLFAIAQGLWALSIGSSQFLKDAIDWIYTILLNAIAAFVFGRGAQIERLSAFVIAAILAAGGAYTLYDLSGKIAEPRPIDPQLLGFSALSAIIIAYITAGVLARFRNEENPLIKATWLSARNDAIATTFSACLTLALRLAPVRWPEYAMDLLDAGLAFQAAIATTRAVVTAAPVCPHEETD
uniref:cation transporter n=1 Tax=unclassified Methylobacterium TaxID=2615210 RepID=UPI00226A58F4